MKSKSTDHSAFPHSRRNHLKALGLLPLLGSGLMTTSRSINAADLACTLAPSMTEGPFWKDEKLNRANLTTNTSRLSVVAATPLTLAIRAYDDNGLACSIDPASNVQIDLWHCDAAGEYSDVSGNGQSNTVGQDFLRGYQVTDASGKTTFTTIYPGWYNGRTAHIHLRARVYNAAGNTTYNFTTQLFFDDLISDSVYAKSPYNTRGTRNTRNSNDGIYLGSSASPLVKLTTNADGSYFGEVALGLAGVPVAAQVRTFAVTVSKSGTATVPVITADVAIASADTGASGEIYVAAEVAGSWYFNNGTSWQLIANPATAGFPAFYRGVLGTSHHLTLLSGIDISKFGKINLYAGYGIDNLNMLQNQRYKLVATLN